MKKKQNKTKKVKLVLDSQDKGGKSSCLPIFFPIFQNVTHIGIKTNYLLLIVLQWLTNDCIQKLKLCTSTRSQEPALFSY